LGGDKEQIWGQLPPFGAAPKPPVDVPGINSGKVSRVNIKKHRGHFVPIIRILAAARGGRSIDPALLLLQLLK